MRILLEDAYEMYQLAQNLGIDPEPYYIYWKQLEADYEAYKKERTGRLGAHGR